MEDTIALSESQSVGNKQSSPRTFEEGKIRDVLSQKASEALKNQQPIESAIDLTPEEVSNLSLKNYAQFVNILSRTDSPELINRYSDIIVKRFGNDLDLSKIDENNSASDMRKIADSTKTLIWNSTFFDEPVFSKENLEQLYGYVHGPREQWDTAIEYANNIGHLSRKYQDEESVDYFSRFEDDIVNEIFGENPNLEKATHMANVLYADAGASRIAHIFVDAIKKAKYVEDIKATYRVCGPHLNAARAASLLKELNENGEINNDQLDDIMSVLGFTNEIGESIDSIESDPTLSPFEKQLKLWSFANNKVFEKGLDPISNSEWDNYAYMLYGSLSYDLAQTDLLQELLKDSEFEAREELVELINYDLWLEWRGIVLTNERNTGQGKHTDELASKKEKAYALYSTVLQQVEPEGRSLEAKSIFNALDNIGDEDGAEALLFTEGLTSEQRLRIAVEHINVFGFITTIDKISARATSDDISTEEKNELEMLYKKLQGDEATNISKELSEIYERIDFSKYEINKDQLTENEVDKIEKIVDGDKQTWVLDVGAGTGRHSLTLAHRGYNNVVAFEYEQKHVDMMRETNPDLKVVQGDWTRLRTQITQAGIVQYHEKDDGTVEKQTQKMDLVYSLGRTLCHNRTPEAMFKTFDQIVQVLKDEGKLYFDMPDVDWGVYQERIQSLRNNLEELGVERTESGKIFDGPNDYDKFNRMIMTSSQIKSMADVLGYRFIEQSTEDISSGIKNIYYTLEKDPDFDATKITPDQHKAALYDLGLFEPDTDMNTYVEAWGMTIAQSIIFVRRYGLNNPHIRYLNEIDSKHAPDIYIFRGKKGLMSMETSGMTSRDDELAKHSQNMTYEEYLQFRSELNSSSPSPKLDQTKL